MHKITPFLWFDHQAEDAARFYTSVFKNSKIGTILRYGEGGPGPSGSVMTVEFELDGLKFTGLNGGPHVNFNESVSFVVHCEDQKEVDEYYETLSAGGSEIQCGWVRDKFDRAEGSLPAAKRFGRGPKVASDHGHAEYEKARYRGVGSGSEGIARRNLLRTRFVF